MNPVREINEELSLARPQRNTPPAPKTPHTPPQPAGPTPFLKIGCPGCAYTTVVTGVWAPYQHERSGTWLRVWFFSATCPHCQHGTERPFSVFKSEKSLRNA